jgi:hypothetical protein
MGARTLYEGTVRVHYGQIYVQSTDDIPMLYDALGGQANGLCGAAVPGALFLATALHTGRVGLAVELHDEPPPLGAEWEEIVEASFTPASPRVFLAEWGGQAAYDLDLDQRDWRARYCATGMDAADQAGPPADGETPIDHYLIQFWPAPPAIDQVVRLTSACATRRHQAAREMPAVDPPKPAPEDERLRREWERLMAAGAPAPATSPRPRTLAGLARLDPDLARAVAAAPPDVQRTIAVWAAHRACEVAGIAALDWVSAGLDSLDGGEPLPAPFDHVPNAFARLHGGDSPGEMALRLIDFADGERPPARVDPRFAALPAIPAAAGDDPARAAADALCAAAAAHGDDVQMLFDQVRYTFRLG